MAARRVDRTQQHRFLGVTTPLGDDVLLLQRCTVTETLGRLFHITLDMLSTDFDVDFDQIVGQNVTVRVDLKDNKTRYFNGYVSQFSQGIRAGRLASYRAVVVPFLWFLTRHSDCRIFQNKTVPDIVKLILREHGYTDLDDRLTGTYLPWEYCCEYRESDFHFISRLLEQEGIYYFFTHEDGKHKLVLVDGMAEHVPFPDYGSLDYRPADQALRGGDYLFDWSTQKTVQPGVYRLNDYEFKTPKKNLHVDAAIPRPHAGSEFDIYDYPGEYTQFAEAKQVNQGRGYARVRIEELHAEHEVHHGQTNSPGVAVGHKLTIADFIREDRNGDFLITSATHSFETDVFDSSFAGHGGGGSPVTCSFTAISVDEVFRPARTTPKPVIEGPQTAIVCGKAGEEIHTDKFGRVMVKFHWDRRSQADETSSCWIRVTQGWAGKRWGALFIPRIGHEVIVEFLEGDPDRPIITGCVYDGDEMPPYELPAHKTRSTIKTNSSKGGKGYNEIRFEDKKGKEQIYIHGERNTDTRVKNDALEWIGQDRHMIVKRDQFEKVEQNKHSIIVGDRKTRIDANDNLTVKVDRKTKVGGTDSLDVGADRLTKVKSNDGLEAGQNVHVKAGVNIVIEAGVALTLKAGGGFVMIDPAGVTIQGILVKINSGGSAGSATAVAPPTPDLPDDPKLADSDKPGDSTRPGGGQPPRPVVYSSQAQALRNAAQSGTPFCEVCEQESGGGGGSEGQTDGGGEGGSDTAEGDGPTDPDSNEGSTKSKGGGGGGPEGRSDDFKPGQKHEPPPGDETSGKKETGGDTAPTDGGSGGGGGETSGGSTMDGGPPPPGGKTPSGGSTSGGTMDGGQPADGPPGPDVGQEAQEETLSPGRPGEEGHGSQGSGSGGDQDGDDDDWSGESNAGMDEKTGSWSPTDQDGDDKPPPPPPPSGGGGESDDGGEEPLFADGPPGDTSGDDSYFDKKMPSDWEEDDYNPPEDEWPGGGGGSKKESAPPGGGSSAPGSGGEDEGDEGEEIVL